MEERRGEPVLSEAGAGAPAGRGPRRARRKGRKRRERAAGNHVADGLHAHTAGAYQHCIGVQHLLGDAA